MNRSFLFLLLLVSQALFAADYYSPGIDTYDPATGLYFKSVERMTDGGGILGSKSAGVEIININVFDPSTGESRLLFQSPPAGQVFAVLYESGFKDGSMTFGGNGASNFIKNNESLKTRSSKNGVLVAVRNSERKDTTLYITEKQAGFLKRLATLPSNAGWHIDVKNSRIRIIQQTGNGIKIDSLPW